MSVVEGCAEISSEVLLVVGPGWLLECGPEPEPEVPLPLALALVLARR